jgi:glycosyltransferase involved in cell wall biosynthesis
VHCHDLLALRSALGDIPENATSSTGRVYQRWIRSGFRRARHFISISRRTRDELHAFGGAPSGLSEVVLNGLNHPFQPMARARARERLMASGLPAQERGCLLHVGGGQWYKNSVGVVRLYAAYAQGCVAAGSAPLPLWMVSPPPDAALTAALAHVPAAGDVRFFQGLHTDLVEALYSHAQLLLFPSLAEGFGWPILEAMACGCPVLTTGEAPMTEVGGDVPVYLPRLAHAADIDAWATHGARAIAEVLGRDAARRAEAARAGLERAARFGMDGAIEAYLSIYRQVLERELPASQEATAHASRQPA